LPEKQRVDPQLPEKALQKSFSKKSCGEMWRRRGEVIGVLFVVLSCLDPTKTDALQNWNQSDLADQRLQARIAREKKEKGQKVKMCFFQFFSM